MLILAGGIVGSFGVNAFARAKIGRSFIGQWRWWGLALYYLAVTGVLVAGMGWVLRTAIAAATADGALESPWFFLTFGLVIGLPFTLPRITGLWREQNAPRQSRRAKDKPASREDRLEFAKELERQLREYGGESRTIDVELQGDKGKVMFFRGDITREEGERLVTALRGDFQAVNLERVEGEGKQGKWWVRV